MSLDIRIEASSSTMAPADSPTATRNKDTCTEASISTMAPPDSPTATRNKDICTEASSCEYPLHSMEDTDRFSQPDRPLATMTPTDSDTATPKEQGPLIKSPPEVLMAIMKLCSGRLDSPTFNAINLGLSCTTFYNHMRASFSQPIRRTMFENINFVKNIHKFIGPSFRIIHLVHAGYFFLPIATFGLVRGAKEDELRTRQALCNRLERLTPNSQNVNHLPYRTVVRFGCALPDYRGLGEEWKTKLKDLVTGDMWKEMEKAVASDLKCRRDVLWCRDEIECYVMDLKENDSVYEWQDDPMMAPGYQYMAYEEYSQLRKADIAAKRLAMEQELQRKRMRLQVATEGSEGVQTRLSKQKMKGLKRDVREQEAAMHQFSWFQSGRRYVGN